MCIHNSKEETLFPKNFISFFINSNPNLTQTQILTPMLTPNLTLTQTLTQILILTINKANEKGADEYFSFWFCFL